MWIVLFQVIFWEVGSEWLRFQEKKKQEGYIWGPLHSENLVLHTDEKLVQVQQV